MLFHPHEILLQMRTSFAEQLPLRIGAIRQAVLALIERPRDEPAQQKIRHLLHSLIGASGTFGMATIGLSARYLDDVVEHFIQNSDFTESANEPVCDALEQLECLASKQEVSEDQAVELLPEPVRHRAAPLIYVVEDDPVQAEVLCRLLTEHGYRVQAFTELNQFCQACLHEPLPFVIIMDMIFPEGAQAGADAIAALKHQILGGPPIIFVSVRDDLQARLAAYHAGASRYLCKPVQPSHLLRVLNEYALNTPHKPYQVLIVDDEPLLLELHASILREAGMNVRTEVNPLNTLNVLREFHADVLLLDVYMPECEGTELAAVIREDERFTRLPILFLSAETSLTKQLAALEFGGDDFLVKPVAPAHLVMAVKMRAQRMRRKLQLMETLNDSLMDFVRVQALQRSNGNLRKVISVHQQTEQELRVLAAAFETPDAIMITDSNAKILRVNQSFQKITGYTDVEVLGKTPQLFKSGRHTAEFYSSLWATLLAEGGWAGEIWDKRKDGEIYPKYLTITAVQDETGSVSHYVAVFRDISDAKRIESEIRTLAFYDQLTELPNRRLLMDRVYGALLASDRSQQYGALLFIDLDNFKNLNDTYGHNVGDLMLIEVAARLSDCVREVDTVARMGGDEFVVLLENLSEDKREAILYANTVAEKIRLVLGESYQLSSCEHRSTPSIGVTLFYAHAYTMDELFKRADTAMYRAKAAGRNAICFFDERLH